MRSRLGPFLLFSLAVFFQACDSINSNRILFNDPKAPYAIDSVPPVAFDRPLRYGDKFTLFFAPNQGEKLLIQSKSPEESNGVEASKVEYTIDSKGYVNLPLLGPTLLEGKTISEAEALIQESLSKELNNPLIEITLTNQRVLYFSGQGKGKTIPMLNENMTLMEVIALGDGIPENSKSTEIHLFREVQGKRKVYSFDISNIGNPNDVDVRVMNGDILVVDHYPKTLTTTLREINPWINIVSGSLALITIILRL